MLPVTERLAQFIVDTTFEQLTPQVVQTAENAILDSLGTTFAGSREEAARLVANQVREYQTAPVSTVIGAGFKAAPPFAALANGTAAHALDFDDGTVSVHGHPSVATVPALLAMAESCGATGPELIAAYAVAYEVGHRIGQAVNPRHYDLGFHATSTVGVFRAVTASARLLRLDLNATRRALGIAASMSCGLNSNFGSMTKPLHPGLASRNGVMAAQLAARGFTSNMQILETEGGFFETFCGGKGYRPEAAVEGLGNPLCLEHPGIVFKPYPCCSGGHAIIDSILYLRQQHHLQPDQIERIRCGVDYLRPQTMRHAMPVTVTQARFSMPFCASVAVLDGKAGLGQFAEARLKDPALRAMMERVEIYVHPSMTDVHQEGVVVDVFLRDGSVLHHAMIIPPGTNNTPMTHEQLVAKFRDCAGAVLSPEDVELVIHWTETLPEQQGVTGLLAILGQRPA